MGFTSSTHRTKTKTSDGWGTVHPPWPATPVEGQGDMRVEMGKDEQPMEVETIQLREVADALRQTRPFADTDVRLLNSVQRLNA